MQVLEGDGKKEKVIDVIYHYCQIHEELLNIKKH